MNSMTRAEQIATVLALIHELQLGGINPWVDVRSLIDRCFECAAMSQTSVLGVVDHLTTHKAIEQKTGHVRPLVAVWSIAI